MSSLRQHFGATGDVDLDGRWLKDAVVGEAYSLLLGRRPGQIESWGKLPRLDVESIIEGLGSKPGVQDKIVSQGVSVAPVDPPDRG